MFAEYKCVFGISSCLPRLPAGQLDITHKNDVSTLVITGKGGRIFWFLFVRMPQIYKASNIPRFTKSETDILAQQHLDLPILPEGSWNMEPVGTGWKPRLGKPKWEPKWGLLYSQLYAPYNQTSCNYLIISN